MVTEPRSRLDLRVQELLDEADLVEARSSALQDLGDIDTTLADATAEAGRLRDETRTRDEAARIAADELCWALSLGDSVKVNGHEYSIDGSMEYPWLASDGRDLTDINSDPPSRLLSDFTRDYTEILHAFLELALSKVDMRIARASGDVISLLRAGGCLPSDWQPPASPQKQTHSSLTAPIYAGWLGQLHTLHEMCAGSLPDWEEATTTVAAFLDRIREPWQRNQDPADWMICPQARGELDVHGYTVLEQLHTLLNQSDITIGQVAEATTAAIDVLEEFMGKHGLTGNNPSGIVSINRSGSLGAELIGSISAATDLRLSNQALLVDATDRLMAVLCESAAPDTSYSDRRWKVRFSDNDATPTLRITRRAGLSRHGIPSTVTVFRDSCGFSGMSKLSLEQRLALAERASGVVAALCGPTSLAPIGRAARDMARLSAVSEAALT